MRAQQHRELGQVGSLAASPSLSFRQLLQHSFLTSINMNEHRFQASFCSPQGITGRLDQRRHNDTYDHIDNINTDQLLCAGIYMSCQCDQRKTYLPPGHSIRLSSHVVI
jgi:hypothetical protein